MDIGLAPLTVGRPAESLLVDAAAEAEFRRVGLTLWPPGAAQSPLCGDPAARRELLDRLAGTGISVLDAGVVTLGPGLDMADVARFVAAAAALGADRLVVVHRAGSADRATEQLAAVCGLAAEAGLRVGVEFMPYTACRTLREATALVTAVATPNAGLVVDVLHLFRSGGSAADLSEVDPARLHLVQLCDALRSAPPPDRLRAEALTDRRYPGQGELPLADVLAALPTGVAMTVESPVAADAGRPPGHRARAAAAAVRAVLDGR
jgi:sugar phosphate isomerase/epimerase